MSLSAGTKLGPYEILAPLGAGGMGEVYRARDTRLHRIVAIKVLADHLASHPELRQRFEREARAVSSLNHPHICTLHDIGHQDGVDYLVMELIEGESLADRLIKGPLPTDQVLRYAIQIADALDKAHRAGIVHRDLKPANIMLTKSGTKLLDFGLAKMQARDSGLVTSVTSLPTERQSLTEEGTILGTFQYMAPEQLEGREADARTDIFAFGAVVYEMATGKRAFTGKSQASLIGAILHTEPAAISTIQPMTPPALDRVVKRCLAKDPDDRWQTARDLAMELAWISEGVSQSALPLPIVAQRKSRQRVLWASVGLAIAAIAVALVFWVLAGRSSSAPSTSRSVKRLTIKLPDAEPLALAKFGPLGIGRTSVALSPDGSLLAYAAERNGKSQLFLRALSQFDARPIPGSEGASSPFFSPDGRSLGFFSESKLKRVSAQGGEPVTICEARMPHGGSWGPDDTIVYQLQLVWQLADGSDSAEVLTTTTHTTTPGSWSPGGKLLAFQDNSPETGFDLWTLPMEGDRQPTLWLKTKFNEWGPAFSRDGKWIAYISDESGQYEVYVRPYRGPGGKRQISTGGGEEVLWSRDGRTLYYREGVKFISVAIQTQPDFRADAPKVMFEGPYLNVPGVSYDVAPDGQHFIMLEENQKQAPTTQLNVVLNWFQELKR